MKKLEKIEALEQALELIEQAQDLVDSVMGDDAHYLSYGRYGFDQLMGNGNPYDYSIPKLIDEISC